VGFFFLINNHKTMGKVRCNCHNCGQFVWVVPYRIKRSKTINCSNECRYKTSSIENKEGEYVNCCICGKEVYKSPSSLRNNTSGRFTCSSQECQNKRLTTIKGSSVETSCSHCNNSLIVPMNEYEQYEEHYCDMECLSKGRKLYPHTLYLRKRVRQRQRVENLDRSYVIQRICTNGSLNASDVPEEFISLKRKQLKLHRLLK